jgi:hypothetical protein
MVHRADDASAPDERPLWPPFRLRCREAAGLLLAAQDRAPRWGERVRLHLHLLACRACTRFDQQLRLMNRAMGRWRAYADAGEDGGSTRSPPPP